MQIYIRNRRKINHACTTKSCQIIHEISNLLHLICEL